MKFARLTKKKGIGGSLEKPEDFIVEEKLPQRFFSKFQRKGGKVNFLTRLNYYLFLVGARGFEPPTP